MVNQLGHALMAGNHYERGVDYTRPPEYYGVYFSAFLFLVSAGIGIYGAVNRNISLMGAGGVVAVINLAFFFEWKQHINQWYSVCCYSPGGSTYCSSIISTDSAAALTTSVVASIVFYLVYIVWKVKNCSDEGKEALLHNLSFNLWHILGIFSLLQLQLLYVTFLALVDADFQSCSDLLDDLSGTLRLALLALLLLSYASKLLVRFTSLPTVALSASIMIDIVFFIVTCPVLIGRFVYTSLDEGALLIVGLVLVCISMFVFTFAIVLITLTIIAVDEKKDPDSTAHHVPWVSKLFTCSCGECLLGTFCPCYLFGLILEYRDGRCGWPGYAFAYLVSCFLGLSSPLAFVQRYDMRMDYSIQGNVCEDCCCHAFCHCCSLIQEHRHVEDHRVRTLQELGQSNQQAQGQAQIQEEPASQYMDEGPTKRVPGHE